MAKGGFIGVNETARKLKKGWVGINGASRKLKKGWVGVNGVARQIFSAVPDLRYIFNNGSYDAESGNFTFLGISPAGFRNYAYGSVGSTIDATLEEYDYDADVNYDGATVIFSTNNAVDLTDYAKIVLVGTQTMALGATSFGKDQYGVCLLGVGDYKRNVHFTRSSYQAVFNAANIHASTYKGAFTIELDVSNVVGMQYIYVGFSSYVWCDNEWSISQVMLRGE